MISRCIVTTLLFPLVSVSSSSVTPVDQYTQNAVQAITTLNNEFYDVGSGLWGKAWWNSANAFTTLADFASLRASEANELNVGGYLHNTFLRAQNKNLPACVENLGFDNFINDYYDDEGWWALALIRFYHISGDVAYLTAAEAIFTDMQSGKETDCRGGIFWSKKRQYVNAISNELYLAVAASLAVYRPTNMTYVQVAVSQWAWFNQSGMINNKGLINDGLDSSTCKNNGQQTWSYNQGVILGGLVTLANVTGERRYIDAAISIATAAITNLSEPDNILHETDNCELKEGHCGGDGSQFKGIFVRNLLYLHQVAPRDDIRAFILRNADYMWENNNYNGLLGVSWSGPYINATGASQSSAIDLLVAAIGVA